jgi:hypothetical protein
MTLKFCNKCRQQKDESEFPLGVGRHGNGKRYRKSPCKRCRKPLKRPPVIHQVGDRFKCWTVDGPGDRASTWVCRCDCGQRRVWGSRSLANGYIPFSCGCTKPVRIGARGPKSPRWKGGRRVSSDGYVVLQQPHHPNANKAGSVFEHVVVMSSHIGRPLRAGETVHHRNGIRSDNRIENLELWAKNHGPGQRVEDLIYHAVRTLKIYAPHLLCDVEFDLTMLAAA